MGLRPSFSVKMRYSVPISPTGRNGTSPMIDLSPQPHDESAARAELRPHSLPAPRPDPGPAYKEADGRGASPHGKAEAAVEFFSRWAGPAILVAAVGALGWFLFD